MKTKLTALFIGLTVLVGIHEAAAQTAEFFRIAGPTVVTITKFQANGSMVWSGATPGVTYAVQMATTLAGGGNWVDYNQIIAGGSVSTNTITSFTPPAGMVLIPAGAFTIGDTLDGEWDAIPAVTVNISAFYMDTNLVSYGQWEALYDWARTNGYTFDYGGAGKATNHPVQMVNWFDCMKWCNARSQQAGLTPVYYSDAGLSQPFTGSDGLNFETPVYANWGANGYRLPTEAEWEKAARGGLSGKRFPWGNTISESQANYQADPASISYDLGPYSGYNTNFDAGYPTNGPCTSPVGYFAPNGYGLYDMAGNVFEWCWDWYEPPMPGYPAGSPYLGGTDPHGPVFVSGERVLRGGSWGANALDEHCAERNAATSSNNAFDIGFRCVRGL